MPARDQGHESLSWLSGGKEDVNSVGQGVFFQIHRPYLLQHSGTILKFGQEFGHLQRQVE